jgi:SAM-dependent methyltransferase
MSNICKICGNENNSEMYILKEMMFGLMDEFEYFKCGFCNCLQINKFPQDIKKYYPPNYLSFTKPSQSLIKNYLLNKRDKFSLTSKGLIGKFLSKKFGHADFFLWYSNANLNKDDSILDVGCGGWRMLIRLNDIGFHKLLGIDPYIEYDIIYNESLRILKKDLSQIDDLNFDWVMFHHVFEHLDNPHETFRILKRIVKKHSKVLIRIPVIDSYAWEFYKTDWVQLDPPRHYFIHTTKSIMYLASTYGFNVYKIIYDSTSFQFWGSEQYKRQIPLMSSQSYFVNHSKSIFSKNEIKQFEKLSEQLNKNQKGDTACFFLENLD